MPKGNWFFSILAAALFGADSSLAAGVTGLGARAGDRCVTLHWQPPEGVECHIFRGEKKDGPYSEIPGSPVRARSFADLNVENARSYFYRVTIAGESAAGSEAISAVPQAFRNDEEFLEFLQATAFDYFWCEVNRENGLVRDRNTESSPCSIAALGFGLTAIGIGVDHGWITRTQGAERTARVLRTLLQLPQGPGVATAGQKGWFYHFLDMRTRLRFRKCELSSIDTALLLAGVLYSKEFFNADNAIEREIGSRAQELSERVEWKWMLNGGDTLSMGWKPETGFIKTRWTGYSEGSILYLLALGASASARLEPKQWEVWKSTYQWSASYGYSFIHFAPLFGHQYTACWVDFHGLQDEYTRAKGITYFENGRRATLAQRAYAMENPKKFPGYGMNQWGFTACDGPGSNGALGYAARGAPAPAADDGTIAPTAAGGSLPFAPNECIAALQWMYSTYRERILCGYGFRDAFNLSQNWFDPDVLGIDQGPILIMAENLRTGKVWQVMQRCNVLERGLERAGFRKSQQ